MSNISPQTIAARLQNLAAEMLDVAADMNQFGAFSEIGRHGKELAGAAEIAQGWADGIREDWPAEVDAAPEQPADQVARPVPAEPVNGQLLETLRYYAEGHHLILHDPDAWDTVSGEPQNFLEDEANTATIEDGSLAKAALSAIGEVPISFDLKTALDGVKNFFDGEYFHIDEIVDASQVCGQKQEEECQPEFDHCFVNQSGGGITGDDYHGTVFFHVGAGQYLTVGY